MMARKYRKGFDVRSIRPHVAQSGVHCLTIHISCEQELGIVPFELTLVLVHESALIETFISTVAHDANGYHNDWARRSLIERFPKFFSFTDGAALIKHLR